MAKSKLNLTVILKHLDLRNLELYEAMRGNEEERKEFDRVLGYLLPLWYSGTFGSEDQISLMIDFNRHVNLDWPNLEGHPELRAKVLGAIGVGHVVKHDFHYRTRTTAGDALKAFLEQSYPDIREDEVQLWCSRNSITTLTEMCSRWGIQDIDKSAIIDAYKKLVT
jgi:hypothetical protein